ncbi:MAG: formylglycine-generating enzyme family protein [Richelia sp. RM1_1_1]|nr:formylglycine-generating enzyme family protein [Richelia sp. RM1_1_1]
MEGKTRDRLLRRLCIEFGEQRLKELANFMSQYIANRLQVKDNDRALVLGERPNWTALAYLSADGQEAINAIKSELQRLTASADASERIKWAALVENYADLLSEKGFEPLLLQWAQNTLEAQPIQDDEETVIAKAMGIELQPFDYDVAVINPDTQDDESEDELKSFEFETVTVDNRGQVINKQQNQAFYFIEYLGEKAGEPAELGIEMVAIPGGTFEMGSPKNEPKHLKSESPQHTVSIQPFFMGKYPVTQAQWRFVAQLPQVNREINSKPSNFKGDDLPVEKVNWYEAVEFCDRLSKFTGRTYSLPTEAEWEYACRAGTTTPFYFGQTITGELSNYRASETYANESKGKYRQETTPVGQFPPNTFGLYDIHGNVWEWCLDDWHKNYEGAPTDGSPWFDDKNDNLSRKQGAAAVLRGGSWLNIPQSCRSAYRLNCSSRDNYYSSLGFRVVCVVGRTS